MNKLEIILYFVIFNVVYAYLILHVYTLQRTEHDRRGSLTIGMYRAREHRLHVVKVRGIHDD